MNRLMVLLILTSLACGVASTLPKSANSSQFGGTAKQTVKPMVEMVVCGSYGLNIRTGAGTSFPLVREEPFADGTPVEIIEKLYDVNGNMWYRITFEGGSGVVRAKYLCGEK